MEQRTDFRPMVVVDVSEGLIHWVCGDAEVDLIFIDSNLEGIEEREDQIHNILGVRYYVQALSTESENIADRNVVNEVRSVLDMAGGEQNSDKDALDRLASVMGDPRLIAADVYDIAYRLVTETGRHIDDHDDYRECFKCGEEHHVQKLRPHDEGMLCGECAAKIGLDD